MKLAVFVAAAAAMAGEVEFVRIPAGEFEMGCAAGLPCAEGLPKRRVVIERAFEMGRTEVTVEQFRRFVKATGYRTDAEKAGDERTWRSPGFAVKGSQPVVYMTMRDAEAFCGWAGARLPGEAEWEYAARAGSTTHHYWGEEMDERYLWFRGNSDYRPQGVGRKKPNAWGLYDVEGNAWEWVTGGGANSSVTLAGHGTIRGGGWMTCPEPYPPKNGVRMRQIGLGVTFENFKASNFKADWRRDDSGFRCARD